MKKQESKGITLVALIITVIILLILAGVTMNAISSTNLIRKSEEATDEYKKKDATEIMNLKITNIQLESYEEKQRMPTLKELAIELSEDKEIEYVYTESQLVANLDEETLGRLETASSIFTKLKAYSYEFEIDSSLQIKSIDAVEVTTGNVYVWSKYSVESYSSYAYHITQSDVSKSISTDGMHVQRAAVSSLDGQFNTSTGLWTYDLVSVQGNPLGYYMSPGTWDSTGNKGKGSTSNTLWYVKTCTGSRSVRKITYDIYQSYSIDLYKQGTTDYGFVTSNDENAYPSSGEQLDETDGVVYWYVKQ